MGAGALGFDPALLRSIAERVGTPAYVYSANLIRAQYHALQDALKDVPHRICYSVKANGNIGVLRVLRQLGAGADIVSAGELKRALAAGFDPGSMVFSGVGKTAAELEEAIRSGVGFLNVESTSELEAVQAAAKRVGKKASIGIRVNPDVAADTHPYTKTGEKTAKFGVPFDEVLHVAQRVAADPLLTLRGLAMHLGSQITDVEPYHRGTVKLLELVAAIRESGDFLAPDRKLPAVRAGEYLAVLGTGAYGFVMSSTYNARPRPPEVLVDGDRYYLARQRETLDDLLRGEVLEPTTWYQA